MTLISLIGKLVGCWLSRPTLRLEYCGTADRAEWIRLLPRRNIKPSCGETWRALFTEPKFACCLAKFSQSFLLPSFLFPCFLLAYLFICSLCLGSFFPPRLLIAFLLYLEEYNRSLLSSFITQTSAKVLLNNLLTEETQRLGRTTQLYIAAQPIVIR